MDIGSKEYWEKQKADRYKNDPEYRELEDKRKRQDEEIKQALRNAYKPPVQPVKVEEPKLEAIVESAPKEQPVIEELNKPPEVEPEVDQERMNELKVLKSWGRRQIIKNLTVPSTAKILANECSSEQEQFTPRSIYNRLAILKELGFVRPIGSWLWELTDKGERFRNKYLKQP